MEKIYNIIPGVLIDNDSIADRIAALIDSVEFDEWIERNETIYSSEFLQRNDEFYVMYLDPRGVIKKLYHTYRDDLVRFMQDRIHYEQGEGVDIAICTKEIENAVICNHDGQIFTLKF